MAMRNNQQVAVEQDHLLRDHLDRDACGQQALSVETHFVQGHGHLAQLFLCQRLFPQGGRIFVAFGVV
ncbi:hypothetical protein D3C71_2225790 [compost metagenome]